MVRAAGADDTICAMATTPGSGGIGILRLSGAHAVNLADQFVRLRSGASLRLNESHKLYLADLIHPRTPSSINGVIDEVFVVVMRAPRSYTGEDVVEIQGHGNSVIASRMVSAALAAGCRLAEPGEFTRRAFLNGRLDLSQAEAVLDTIEASSEEAAIVAQRHLRGDLGRVVAGFRDELVTLLAHVEAGIDFVDEEDTRFIDERALMAQLDHTRAWVARALETAGTGRLLREGARVVLAGPPNVGKSSLLNALLREERAIVSPVPGTTRDVIEESMLVNGLRVSLMDTAGLRHTGDALEEEGMRRTRAALSSADLVLHVRACTEDALKAEDIAVRDGRLGGLDVWNKADLLKEEDRDRMQWALGSRPSATRVLVSALTGEGIADLRDAIHAALFPPQLEAEGGVVITNLRHVDALQRTGESLNLAIEAIQAGKEAECIAVDLRAAADALGEITGAITSDEILNKVFSTFCIGK